MAAGIAAGAAGCSNKVPDTEETLEVYCRDAGYGYAWCEALLDAFKQQDWVQQKYPNLQVAFDQNQVASYAESKLKSGAEANTIDLFFATGGYELAGVDSKGNDYLADLTEYVYGQNVPGENVLFIDKVQDSYNTSNLYHDVTATTDKDTYYFVSWADGMDGILYNADILESLGIPVPVTTDEWLASMRKIKDLQGNQEGKYSVGYSILQSNDAPNYVDYMFYIWWAQYEGIDNYLDFFNGIDSGRYSSGIFDQVGRVEALKVLEQAVNKTNDYVNPTSFTDEYLISQTEFLRGKAVYHMNGDWFDNEMREIKEEIKQVNGLDYDIQMMRTPVISSIVTQTPSIQALAKTRGITENAALRLVIEAVDSGADSYEGVTAPDFERIREARSIVHSIGPNHTAFIPSYATGKEVAMDFLRFMATDIANEIYIEATGGATLPFLYNVKEKNPQLYESLSDFQKTRIGYFTDENVGLYVLPSENSFPLVLYGGVMPFTTQNYYITFSMSGNTKMPQNYFDDTKAYWTDARWQDALAKAGIVG